MAVKMHRLSKKSSAVHKNNLKIEKKEGHSILNIFCVCACLNFPSV